MRIVEIYKEKIIELIRKTKEGRMPWKMQNPVTYYSEIRTKNGRLALISIQKVRNQLVFTIKDLDEGEIIVNVDSRENVDFEPLLIDLFELARYTIEKRSLDYFDNIINSI